MTDKTATERRLLDSIRQAKTGEEPQGSAAAQSSASSGAPPAGTAKAAPKRAARTARAPKTPTKRPQTGLASTYQSRGRVWPD
jgi:hypothetical protein